MELHDVCKMFPQVPHDDLVALSEDIGLHGLREPILTFRGLICDGRNRYDACLMAGMEPRYEEWQGTEAELLDHVVSLNLHRRHLDPSQRAIVAAKIAAKSPKRPSVATEEAAQQLGVSRRSVSRAMEAHEKAIPEVIEKMEKGEVSVNEAAKVSRLPKEKQKAAVEKVESGEARNLTQAAKPKAGKHDPLVERVEALLGEVCRAVDQRFNTAGRKLQDKPNRDTCHGLANDLLKAWEEWK